MNDPKLGDKAICKACGKEIVFIGPYWDHPGDIKPRHPAWPVEDEEAPGPPVSNKLAGTVPFTQAAIISYLDRCIRFWRQKRDKYGDDVAVYYIDAFQSMRVSLVGETLPDVLGEVEQRLNTCKNCRHFNRKLSGSHNWGECLNPKVLDLMRISFRHVEVTPPLLAEVRTYARIQFDEDEFGCIHFEAEGEAGDG